MSDQRLLAPTLGTMDATGPEHHDTQDGMYQPGLELASPRQPDKGEGSWTGVAPVPAWQSGEKTVCGLRKTTFVLSILLAVAVVLAAVGTGVGAGLAVNNARECVLQHLSFRLRRRVV
jgi:hypothetical protein